MAILSVELQSLESDSVQSVLGQHTAHSFVQNTLGKLLLHHAGFGFCESTGLEGVFIVNLLLPLVSTELNFVRIRDDDKITDIHVT